MSTNDDLQAQLKALKAENEALRAKKLKPVTMKIGEKGGLSVYGINSRFPVSLYANQWQRLAPYLPEILAFIEANKDKMSFKE
jgi:hypothetical protein